jgi:FemAB-related protein (PEP-CTERM system-associated)
MSTDLTFPAVGAAAARHVGVSDDVPEQAWSAFVETTPAATGYHQWGWRRVFEQAFGHRTVYLAARDDDNLAGILPIVLFDSWLFGRFGVSLPFVNYGGIVATSEPARAALFDAARSIVHKHRLSHLELRHLKPQGPGLPSRTHKVAMTRSLPHPVDALWQQLDRKVRNQVRKGEKSGLMAVSGGAELLDDFYRVFARNMRDLGTPVYSRRFFEAVVATFPATTRVFVVRLGSAPVAAAVTTRWRDTVEVPWASSLREHRALAPNMLLYWHMLRTSVEEGARVFDFGRSTPDEGTFHFKRQWGAEPVTYSWEYVMDGARPVPNQSPSNPKYFLAIEAWKRLPVPVATWLGPGIVRSIP